MRDPRERELLPTPSNNIVSPSNLIDLRGHREYDNNHNGFFKAPKGDLPRFSGEDAKG